MSKGVVRQSKFRHVFGTPARKDACIEGFRVTNCAFEGNFIAANGKFVAACVEVGGGGAFIVLPIDTVGRLDPNLPKVSAHKEYVLDLQWNPYNDNMLATCSEDGSIRVWEIPDRGLLTNWEDDKTLLTLDYHQRRCVQIAWHPIASNVLMSVSQEPKVIIWNLDDGVAEVEIEDHPDIIYNASWSPKGDKIVTVCKDKKFRIFDARTGTKLLEGQAHEGGKAQRVAFCHKGECLISTGFSRMSERQFSLWKVNLGDDLASSTVEELQLMELDTANGVPFIYHDPDTMMVYIAAKGDTTIRYYELDANYNAEEPLYYLGTYSGKTPQRGLADIPKRSVNVNNCEVMKFYKLRQEKTGIIEPISMTVPRKSELYQDDLYPDAIGLECALEAVDWFEGEDAEPIRIPMEQFFTAKSKSKAAGGGGLKKGGLKGLKAKKDAKEAAKKPSDDKIPPAATTGNEKKEATTKATPAPDVSDSTPSASNSTVDAKDLEELRLELQSLKVNEKKMQDELKALADKVKDYDKLAADIKLLCDAVKKNDERLAPLEALVQADSDDEEGEKNDE